MRFITLTTSLTVALLLGACATSRSDSQKTTSTAPAAETPPIAPAVKVPAASARKVVLWMTGPKQVVEAKDWADFKREWRETFAEHAKGANIAFSVVESNPQAQGQDGTLLIATIDDYRMVGIGARIFLGVMSGNAYIDANIRFVNLRDGAAFGEQKFNTTSSAWGGVVAKVTPQQVDAIGAEVFRNLKPAQ